MANHDILAQQKKGQPTLKVYIIGYVLSIILTVAAFALINKRALFTDGSLYIGLTVLVVVQFLVQVLCFFRLNTKTEEGRWNVIALLFTIIIMGIVVTGSLWIMYNLNYYMVN